MVRNLILQADRFQAELIVSDIPHSCKAYLRGLAVIGEADAGAAPAAGAATAPVAGRLSEPAAPEAELASLLETARRLAESLGAKTLLAGFRPDGPIPSLGPENPPAGMHHYTSFVHLSAQTAKLAAPAGTPETLAQAAQTDRMTAWRRIHLTEEQIGTYLRLHREGLADVPNVPFLTKADARERLTAGQVDLIILPDGTPIGFTDLSINLATGTADLDEIAILPPWRSLGIGRAVIAELARELSDSGIAILTVLVATINQGAMRLYQAMGFASPTLYAHWFQMLAKRQKAAAPLHTADDLAIDLAHLGVRPGETLMVHSSMKSLGFVPGGAEALIEALTKALGPDGTLVMAAHSGENTDPANWIAPPVPADWWPIIREATPPYQPAVTPTVRIGQVPELFRTLPGVLRSSHPSYSFTARGPGAARIVSAHPLGGALGEPSPSCLLADMGARILQIGTDYDTCTVMHLGEYQARCRMHIRQGAAMLVDGRPQWVEYTDTLGNSDEFFGPGRLLESRNQVLTGKVGEASCRLFRVDDAVAAARDWFRENRMRRLGEADRGWLLDLLRHEPEYNLFLIGDVENYGFDEPFQDIMAYPRKQGIEAPAWEKDVAAAPAIDSIVLRYYTNFLVYSEHDDFALEPVLSALDYPTLSMLSAKKAVMERLRPHLPGYRFSDSYMMKRPTTPANPGAGDPDNSDFVPGTKTAVGRAPRPDDLPIELATLDDVPELAAFLFGVAEFAVANQTLEDKTAAMRRSLVNVGTRYVIIREHGRIVACAGTTAENSQSAMVVSVATDPACRRRGHATRLVSRLCELHAGEGREFLCLFYTNPNAGIIYRGLGFAEIGTWVMARPPVRIPKPGV